MRTTKKVLVAAAGASLAFGTVAALAQSSLAVEPGSGSVAFSSSSSSETAPTVTSPDSFAMDSGDGSSVQSPYHIETSVGEQVTLNIQVTGNPTPTVEWETSTDGESWSTAEGTDTSLSFSASEGNVYYRARATNSAGSAAAYFLVSATSDSRDYLSDTGTLATLDKESDSVPQGQAAKFKATVIPEAESAIVWTVDDVEVAACKDQTECDVPTGNLSVGNHVLKVAATAGASTGEDTATLTVTAATTPTDPADTTPPAENTGTAPTITSSGNFSSNSGDGSTLANAYRLSATSGEQVTLTVDVSGSPAPNVTWETSTDGTSWSSAGNGNSLSITATDGTVYYRATATNTAGSDTAYFAVEGTPDSRDNLSDTNTKATLDKKSDSVAQGQAAKFKVSVTPVDDVPAVVWTVDGTEVAACKDQLECDVPTANLSVGGHVLKVAATVGATTGEDTAELTVTAATTPKDPADTTPPAENTGTTDNTTPADGDKPSTASPTAGKDPAAAPAGNNTLAVTGAQGLSTLLGAGAIMLLGGLAVTAWQFRNRRS